MILKNLKNCLVFRLFSFILNFMLACEHSELLQTSRNVISILLKRMYNPVSSANELTLKAKDDKNRVLQIGRSMIEMLGVLAIIAVLSVGGIAGYSKAMEMYKINKTLEHYNYLVLGMLDYVRETKNLAEQTNTGMTMIAEAAGLIPATWQKENNFNLRDDMENIVQIFANKTHLSIDYIFQNSEKHSITDKLCNNLFNNTLKPLSNSIQVIYVTIAGKIDFAIYYSNTTCDAAKSKKCLRNVELNDIRDSCNFCAEQKFCSIAVKF